MYVKPKNKYGLKIKCLVIFIIKNGTYLKQPSYKSYSYFIHDLPFPVPWVLLILLFSRLYEDNKDMTFFLHSSLQMSISVDISRQASAFKCFL